MNEKEQEMFDKEFDELWYLNFPKENWLGKGKLELKVGAMNIIAKEFIKQYISKHYILREGLLGELDKLEVKIMEAISKIETNTSINEKDELMIRYIDVQNAIPEEVSDIKNFINKQE